MLLKHSLQYLVARGVPGVIGFLAIALYSRLLSPDQYGQYALTLATTGLIYTSLFQWLPLSLLRFLPSYQNDKATIFSTLLSAYLSLLLLSGLGAAVFLFAIRDPVLRNLVLVGTLTLWARAWFEFNKELARSELSPKRYGIIDFSKAVLGVALGGTLAHFGFGGTGVLLGFALGMLGATLWNTSGYWQHFKPSKVRVATLRSLLVYGLPLSATAGFAYIVNMSDRALLGWFQGVEQAGLYAAGYDLPRQSIILIMGIVNLAAYPLAVRAYGRKDLHAAQTQLSRNLILLLVVTLPATTGMALLAPTIAEHFMGTEFQAATAQLIPWIAFATLLDGLRMFYVDLSFQLSMRTTRQLAIVSLSAAVNTGLNLLLIPIFGLMGAAYATFIAYAFALVLAFFVSRRVFALRLPLHEIAMVLLATCGMTVCVLLLKQLHTSLALVIQIAGGILSYTALLLLFNVFGARDKVRRVLHADLPA